MAQLELPNIDGHPLANMDPEAIATASKTLTALGANVRDNGTQAASAWAPITSAYKGPGDSQFIALMEPVSTNSTSVGDRMDSVSGALDTLKVTADEVKARMDKVKIDLTALKTKVDDYEPPEPALGGGSAMYVEPDPTGGHWSDDPMLVYECNRIYAELEDCVETMHEAERTCMNTIRALNNLPPISSVTAEGQSYETGHYGVDEIPNESETPWGTADPDDENCGEATVDWFVDGGKDLAGLAGFHWDDDGNYYYDIGESYVGMGSLIGRDPETGEFSWETAGAAWGGMAKGIVAWDRWSTNPAGAFAETVMNVGSMAIPGVNAAKATQLLGKAGKAGHAGRKGDADVDVDINASSLDLDIDIDLDLDLDLDLDIGKIDTDIDLPANKPDGDGTSGTGGGDGNGNGNGGNGNGGNGNDGNANDGNANDGNANDGNANDGNDGNGGNGNDGNGKPDTDGNSKPDTDGNSKPDTDGNSKPDTDGNSKPDTDGNSKPDTDGNSKPDTDGNSKPDTDGNSKPDRVIIVSAADGPGPKTAFAARTDLEPNTVYEVEGRGTFHTNADGRVDLVETAYGTDGLNWDLHHPQPDTTYKVTPNVADPIDGRDYTQTFVTDAEGRTIRAETDWLAFGDARRSQSVQSRIGNEGGADYDGSHLLGNQYAGGPESINVQAWLRKVNQNYPDSFYHLEQQWSSLVEDGRQVQVTVEPNFANPGDKVPSDIEVTWRVDGGAERVRTFDNY